MRLLPRHTARQLALLAAVWIGIGLFFALRNVLLAAYDGQPVRLYGLVWTVIGFAVWIPLTPPILFLARRFPVTQARVLRSAAVHLAGYVAAVFLDLLLFDLLHAAYELAAGMDVTFFDVAPATFWSTLSIDFFTYIAIVAVVVARDSYGRAREGELQAERLQAQLASAQLRALKMQLHPHFLFNTLHAVSALMEEDVRAARDTLALLSELLRLTLEQGERQDATVEQELAFLERYLEIQRIRFRDQLQVALDVDPSVRPARLPTLILQPLVENAIRHGEAGRGEVSRVTIRAAREGDRLVLDVVDNGPGLPPPGPAPRAGIGLRNTRERLEQRYGEAGALTLTNLPEGGLRARLSLPYYTEAEAIEVIG